jgi:hypothetical protein
MAEKRTIELEIQDNSKSLKAQYREAVAELQKVSAQYGETSKEAVKAAKAAADLKDQIGFTKDLVDAFNPDAKFNAASKSIGGLLDGFQAFEGGLALIGVESEDLQKTMVKLQSVMALSQGLQGVLEAKDSFKQLGTVVSSAFGKMTTASKLFLAGGIGLLITAVGLLVANWDKLSGSIIKQTAAQKALIETSDAYVNAAAQATAVTTKVGVAFEEAKNGVISKEKALKIYNDSLGSTFGMAKNLNEAEKAFVKNSKSYVEASALRAQADALIQMSAEKRIELIFLESSARKLAASGVDLTDEYNIVSITARGILKKVENAKKEIASIDNLISVTSQKASNLESTFQTIPTTAGSGIAGGAANTLQTVVDLRRQIVDEQIKAIEDENQRVQTQLIVDAERRIEDVKNTVASEKQKAALIKGINDNLLKDLDKLDAEYYQKQKDKQTEEERLKEEGIAKNKEIAIKLFNNYRDEKQKEIDAEKENSEKKIQIAKEEAEKKKAIEKEVTNAKLQMAKDSLQLISNITELFGRQNEKRAKIAFQVDKAAKLASATISGIEGTINAYKTAQGSPYTAIFPGYPVVQAGLAAAFAATNIAKIAQAKFGGSTSQGGGGNSGGSSGGGGATMTPQFNVVGNNGINQLAQLQQQPIQAYVVSGEVTSAQALDRNRVQNATL